MYMYSCVSHIQNEIYVNMCGDISLVASEKPSRQCTDVQWGYLSLVGIAIALSLCECKHANAMGKSNSVLPKKYDHDSQIVVQHVALSNIIQ